MIAVHDLILGDRMPSQSHPVGDTGDIDSGIIRGDIIQIGPISGLLGVLQKRHLAWMRHHRFKRERPPVFQKLPAQESGQHTGKVGVHDSGRKSQFSVGESKPSRHFAKALVP
jgi:hypothetical protein